MASDKDKAKSWFATLRILTENAINTVPADIGLSSEEIAQAVKEGAIGTGRVSPDDFKSSEGQTND